MSEMPPTRQTNDAPDEFVADLLARQVPAMQQQIMSLQIEVAYRDSLIAELRGEAGDEEA